MPVAPPYYSEDGADLNFAKQAGNTLGAPLVIGTTDAFGVDIEVNGLKAVKIASGAPVNSLTINGSGQIGMGTVAQARQLHLFGGAFGGSIDAGVIDGMIIEDNITFFGLNFLGPNTSQPGLSFGDPEDTNAGIMQYNHNTDNFEFRVAAGNDTLVIKDVNTGIEVSGGLELSLGKLTQSNGGAVTQITNITTGVTLNTDSGEITTVSATLAAGVDASFNVTNSRVGVDDTVILNTKTYGGTADGIPICNIESVAAGSFVVNIINRGAVALDAVVVMTFVVVGGATS